MNLKEKCKEKGIKMQYLAAKLWPNSKLQSQRVSMTQLSQGQRKSIHSDWVEILEKELGMKWKDIKKLLKP